MNFMAWYGLFGPAGLPQEIAGRLVAVARDLLNDPGARNSLMKAGLLPSLLDGPAFAEHIRQEMQQFAQIAARANIDLS